MSAVEQYEPQTRGSETSGTVVPHPALRRLSSIQREFEQSVAHDLLHAMSSLRPERAVETLARWHRLAKGKLIRVAMVSILANLLMPAVPIFLLQISDLVLPDRGLTPLVSLPLLTLILIAAMSLLDIRRRTMLNRAAVSIEMLVGGKLLSAMMTSRPLQERGYMEILRDVHKVRSFLGSPTMLHLTDVPMLPFFLTGLFLINPGFAAIVSIAALVSGIVVLKCAGASYIAQALTAAAILGWGVHLVFAGTLTIGMMIAAAIIAGRALRSLEGVIGGWEPAMRARAAYTRVRAMIDELAIVEAISPPPALLSGIPAENVLPFGNAKQRSHHIAMSC